MTATSHEPVPLVFYDGRVWTAIPEPRDEMTWWTITDETGEFRDAGADAVLDSPSAWARVAEEGEPDVAEAWCALHFAVRRGITDRRAAVRAAG